MILSLQELQENIADSLNYSFLATIQNRLPYNNAYFLICLADVLHEADNDEKLSANTDVFQACIKEAIRIYETTNISAYLSKQRLYNE